MKNYSLKHAIAFSLAIVVFGFLFFVWARSGNNAAANVMDSFAQCLAEKRIVMYGADWCPHCQNEKNAFGGSFRFVPYVECPEDPKRCIAAGVAGYPTWVFPDGRKLEGEQGIEKLSEASGCLLESFK